MEPLTKDERRVAEDGVDVALAAGQPHHDVVAELLVDERRPRREGRLRLDDGVERLVVDGHEFGRVLGDVARLGNHRRDRLAHVAHLADRQARPATLLEDRGRKHLRTKGESHRLERVRDVLAGGDTTHASDAERRPRVDREDPCVRVRTPHEGHVQGPGQADVVDVGCPATEEAWILDPSDGSADELHQRHRVTRARSGGAP